jgi:hypothetical protein
MCSDISGSGCIGAEDWIRCVHLIIGDRGVARLGNGKIKLLFLIIIKPVYIEGELAPVSTGGEECGGSGGQGGVNRGERRGACQVDRDGRPTDNMSIPISSSSLVKAPNSAPPKPILCEACHSPCGFRRQRLS